MPGPAEPTLSARLKAAIDRGIDRGVVRFFGAGGGDQLPDPTPAPLPTPSSPEAPAIAHISEQAEALMKSHAEPPDAAIRIRQDLEHMPNEAQMMWLETYYEAKEYLTQHPEMPRQYPINTAWQAVNTKFDAQKQWAPRTEGAPAVPVKKELAGVVSSLKDATNDFQSEVMQQRTLAFITACVDVMQKKLQWESLLLSPRQRVFATRDLESWAVDMLTPIAFEIYASHCVGDNERMSRAEQALYNLVSAASADQRVTDIINTAKEVGDMPIRAKVDFDAKVGKYVVLHANFLKPVLFTDRKAAEEMAKTLDQETLPKVTHEGDTFKVAHTDWPAPVAVKTAAEAESVVDKKLQDLGEPEAAAKTEAQAVVAQAARVAVANETTPEAQKAALTEMGYTPEQVETVSKDLKPAAARIKAEEGGAAVAAAPFEMEGLTPQVMSSVQEIAAALHISEHELMEKIKGLQQEGGSNVEASQVVQAGTKQGKDTVSGFPKSDVSAPQGKHPNVPGQVSTEEPALKTIEPGKPGAAAAKFDGTQKADPDKSKVDGQHGLSKENHALLMAKASRFDGAVSLQVRASQVLADVQRLSTSPRGLALLESKLKGVVQAATEEAQKFIGEKIEKLRSEGKPEEQAVAAAHSMARAEGYDIPEPK